MGAFDVLRSYLSARASISDAEFALMEGHFGLRRTRAGELLQREGEPARTAFFVAEGCLRSFVIDEKGVERILQFAPEQWWLADIESLTTGRPSRYFVDAIEDTEVLTIDPRSHEALLARVPGYAAAFRTGLQRTTAAKDRRIVSTLTDTARARYEDFLRTYPTIAQRVPQRMIASYLGITPETVSRIRAKAGTEARSKRDGSR